jgi:hypothetical protein
LGQLDLSGETIVDVYCLKKEKPLFQAVSVKIYGGGAGNRIRKVTGFLRVLESQQSQ